MLSNKPQAKLVIVFVDHEKNKLDKIVKVLRQRKVGNLASKQLKDECDFLQVIINVNTTPTRLLQSVVEKIGDRAPDIIFVDVNLGPPSSEGEDRAANKGINLGQKLRSTFPTTPVGLYTAYHLGSSDKIRISAMHFDATLESVNNLIEGPDEVLLTGDTWLELFKEMVRQANDRQHTLPIALTSAEDTGKAKWADGPPTSRSVGFIRAAPRLVSQTLSHLPEAPEILMSQLSGGFSGSFLVRATVVGGGASFVVKIDEDPSALERELKGYEIVESKLDHKNYLHVVGQPARLTEDWWSGFAMAYEVDAKPLVDCLPIDGVELANLYLRLWDECLFRLYGTIKNNETELANIFSPDLSKGVVNGWESLSRYRGRLPKPLYDQIDGFITDITSIDFGVKGNTKVSVPWADHVHGDLNCRNVLYNKQQRTFFLLDFPHVGPSNGLAYDFAKAEAELLLLMLDWSTGQDSDISRIEAWQALASEFLGTFLPSPTVHSDLEVSWAFTAISAIREKYLETASKYDNAESAYVLYLFSRVLKYLTYSDLTPAKRLFTYVWASELYTRLQPSLSGE